MEKKKLPPIEEVFKAFKIVSSNAYAKRSNDNEVLFDVFLAGIRYGQTGEMPKDQL